MADPARGDRVQYLRDLYAFFGVRFKIAPATGTGPTADEAEVEDEEMQDDEDGDVVARFMKQREDEATKTKKLMPKEYMVSCLGVGYSNINKSMA